jgi:hypothetical protein
MSSSAAAVEKAAGRRPWWRRRRRWPERRREEAMAEEEARVLGPVGGVMVLEQKPWPDMELGPYAKPSLLVSHGYI